MQLAFYAAFVPGLEDIVSQVVRERLPDVKIIKLLEGAIIFETECSYDKLNFFCFNNIFALIDLMEHRGSNRPLEDHALKIINQARALSKSAGAVISENSKKVISFRLAFSMENKPSPVDEKIKRETENFVKKTSGLKLDRSRPDTEFWFLYRREGFSLFMKRLTRSFEKTLQDGELSPPLAWLLCRLASLGSGGVALDPFSGYGAIPEAAIKHFPVKKFIALEMENRCVKISRGKKALQTDRCEIHRGDFFSFSFTAPAGEAPGVSPGVGLDENPGGAVFDAIVTDPPWGHYRADPGRENQIPQDEFYEKILNAFFALLKPGGRAVILAGKELEEAALNTAFLKAEKIYPVLVSGKKASVFVFRKGLSS